ncbi:MAG: protein phosphatase 2C domain-containing protein [Calditrichia bacterium]
MSLQTASNLKLDVASSSTKMPSTYRESTPFDHYGSATAIASRKGRLFVIADSKTRRPEPSDAGKMAIDIIQENYFTYPSADIAFCLQRAMDTANRRVYQYAQTNALHKKIGATCSALVITDRHAYVAHVGDCRIYRVSVRKVERLTQEHTRVLDMLPREVGSRDGTRAVLTRALGIKLGVKIETINKIPVQRDEYFIMSTAALDVLQEHEIQSVVLSHTPQTASKKLQELAIERGADGNVAVQVIKIYNEYRKRGREKSGQEGRSDEASTRKSRLGMSITFTFLFGAAMFLLLSFFLDELPQMAEATIGRYSVSLDEEGFHAKTLEERLSNASGYIEGENLHDAVDIYRRILKADPTNAKALFGLDSIVGIYMASGDSFAAVKNWRSAEEDYRLAATIDPENKLLVSKLASVRSEIAKPALARTASVKRSRRSKRLQNVNPEPVAPLQEELLPTYLSMRNWKTPGLYRGDDFFIQNNTMIFENNIRIKKAFGIDAYGNAEIVVNAKRVGGLGNGKYGIIFGHDISDPFDNFYLFTIDKDSRFALQRISRKSIKTIASGEIPVSLNQNLTPAQLKIKCIDKTILLYVNGHLLTMVTDKNVRGGIGLYADPNMRVEFAGLTAEPIVAKLAEKQ